MAPFAPGTLDSTYRPGVDAVRVQSPYGDSGERDFMQLYLLKIPCIRSCTDKEFLKVITTMKVLLVVFMNEIF